MKRLTLLLVALLAVNLSACSDDIVTNSDTKNLDDSGDAVGFPGSVWNADNTFADGDSMEAVPLQVAPGATRAEGVLEAAGIGQYNSFPWGHNLPFRGRWHMGNGYGRNRHRSHDYYSTDWSNGSCTSDILASGAGWVKWAGYQGDYGLTVLLEVGPTGQSNGNRYIQRYSHLSRIDVRPGWWLPKGWRIGKVGRTGYATGCHLHWTTYRGRYIGWGRVDGWSFPPSWSSGVDGYNGGYGWYQSEF